MTKALQSPPGYAALLRDIKERVRTAQVRAALAVKRELILLYWPIGRGILDRQQAEGWGTKVIDRLAKDLGTFPGIEGFSPRNLKYMRAFAQHREFLGGRFSKLRPVRKEARTSIGRVIVRFGEQQNIPGTHPESFEYRIGQGVIALVQGERIVVGAAPAVKALADMNINVVLLTGDSKPVAKSVATQLGIEQV